MCIRILLQVLLIFMLPYFNRGISQNQMSIKLLDEKTQRLYPLHQKKIPPQPGDWLSVHHEPGQSFEEYLSEKPIRPTERLNTIYIQPIADFTQSQQKIIELTAEYISLYFNLPAKILDPLPFSVIPANARRVHPTWGMKQILSTYILDKVLRPRRSNNALAVLGLTAIDLWPGRGWNFVFGQASLYDRVGVWSIYRNGDPDESKEMFRLCLLRTIKTAVHEIGHILTMRHCIAYECVMNGSNHREESDRRPVYLCPVCLKKLCWNLGIDPLERYKRLESFCLKNNLIKEAKFFQQAIILLNSKLQVPNSN